MRISDWSSDVCSSDLLADRRVQRRALLLPVGDQLVQRPRLQHRAGEDVGADFRALLENADGDLLAALGRKLAQSDGRRPTGRAGADDDHVVLHPFAFQDPSLTLLRTLLFRVPSDPPSFRVSAAPLSFWVT